MPSLQKLAHMAGLHVHRWPSPHHLYVDYAVAKVPRWGYGKPAHPQITALLETGRPGFEQVLAGIVGRRELLASIPQEPTGTTPGWRNDWFPPLDAAALMHFISESGPANYLEIGSGTSTMFARHAIRAAGLATRITSIDPEPRAEINSLCDEVIRHRLETVDLSVFDRLGAGDILFFDGSHRTFMDSDVTVFFLDVLPRLPAGLLVQIHDIFWPFDYPPAWGERFYSEQYLLGASLLQGAVAAVCPNHFVAQDDKLSRMIAPVLPRFWGRSDGSFWFRVMPRERRTADD